MRVRRANFCGICRTRCPWQRERALIMMHKASPFTASCNGLIDMDDDTEEVADPAGTVFSGVNPSHLIIELPGVAPPREESDARDDGDDSDREDALPEDHGGPSDHGGETNTQQAMCAVLITVGLVLMPLLRSRHNGQQRASLLTWITRPDS